MAGDWLKLHRKLRRSALMEDPEVFRLWIVLLLEANWDRRQLLDGTFLEPGELIIGQHKLAKSLKTTRQKLRRALKILEKCGNLTIKPTSTGTRITICNWETYQNTTTDDNPPSNQRTTNEQPTDNQRATNEQPQNKKIRSKEVKKERTNTVVPTVGEVAAYVAEKNYPIDPQSFVDYYQARGWKLKGGQPVKDWQACVRTWNNNRVERAAATQRRIIPL